MPYVRSFDDATPPARFDGVPFTLARIQESAASTGPWTLIQTITLSPVDTNPAAPQPRDLTTSSAVLEQGYYRIVWEDAAGAQHLGAPVFYANPATDPPYFTIAEMRAYDTQLEDTTNYPDAKIEAAREFVEYELEHRTGQAFVPRTATEVVDGGGSTDIMLRHPYPISVTSATVDGTALTVSDLALYETGVVYYASGWARGRRNLSITYSHGHATLPPPAKEAALLWAKHYLIKGPIDDRTTGFSSEQGTFALATPGMRGSHTGIPAVDEFIDSYDMNVAVA